MRTNKLFTKGMQLCIALFASVQLANAQAILPTSWSFDTATPEGWTESLGGSAPRYANGAVGQACRLDATADYVQIEFAEEAGTLTYFFKGQNSGGTWQGTMTVQESTDGSNWSALRTFVNDMPTASFTQFSDNVNPASRFIRFYYTNKVSGHNSGLDEVSLSIPAVGAAQEINVSANTSSVPSGSTLVIGNATTTTINIENLGLSTDLLISDVTIGGVNASDFSIASFPTVVGPDGVESFDLTFTPSQDGSRFCTVTIANNDTSEGSYVINVYAIGGDMASEPVAQATALTFPGLSSWDFNVSFAAGTTPAEGYVVLRKKGSAVTETPSDMQTYKRGQWIGGAQVVHVGDAATFNARNIEVSTDYHFAVFAFNGPDGFENYLTDSPTTGVAATLDANYGAYWNGLNHNAPTFVSDLQARLYPTDYFQIFYSNYISTLINDFYVKDTITAGGNSANAVECQYSGDHYIYEAGFQFSGSNDGILSREHSFPQSWMPTYLSPGFDDSEEVSDLHNLLPVRQNECNAVRSNYQYGEVTNITSTYGPCKYGSNDFGQTIYEPRDEVKGDAARAMMYHAAKNTAPGSDFSFPEQISAFIAYGQGDYVIKKWHFQDLPTNLEMARNEYIETRQNNRNAFIDSVDFPCYIRFTNMTKFSPIVSLSNGNLVCFDQGVSYQWSFEGQEIDGATAATFTPEADGNYTVTMRQFDECPTFTSVPFVVAGVNEASIGGMSLDVYPNPNNGQFQLNVSSDRSEKVTVTVYSATGAKISTAVQTITAGSNTIAMDQSNLEAGMYFVEVITTKGALKRSMMVK